MPPLFLSLLYYILWFTLVYIQYVGALAVWGSGVRIPYAPPDKKVLTLQGVWAFFFMSSSSQMLL